MFSGKVKVLPLPNHCFITLSAFICPTNIHQNTVCTQSGKNRSCMCVLLSLVSPRPDNALRASSVGNVEGRSDNCTTN